MLLAYASFSVTLVYANIALHVTMRRSHSSSAGGQLLQLRTARSRGLLLWRRSRSGAVVLEFGCDEFVVI